MNPDIITGVSWGLGVDQNPHGRVEEGADGGKEPAITA